MQVVLIQQFAKKVTIGKVLFDSTCGQLSAVMQVGPTCAGQWRDEVLQKTDLFQVPDIYPSFSQPLLEEISHADAQQRS